ncbi:MAG: hypothetical protein JW797_03325 [Bradymonadales bacterium]|nr:hypothetical protein [Bradymonadales bacterium]
MNRTSLILFLAVPIVLVLRPEPTDAATVANFTVYEITSLCAVDTSCDNDWGTDPEPHYRMAIFDNSSDSTLDACDDGCSGGVAISHDDCNYPSHRCGSWNFLDYTLYKTIPARSGAYFYFGLFDEDVDSSDSLGDHWVWRSTSDASYYNSTWNNNYSPYYPGHHLDTVCGWSTECTGWANNYVLWYRIWFTDTTGPSKPSGLTHNDDSLTGTYYDNDNRLDFSWTPGTDADTGVRQYFFLEYYSPANGYAYYGNELGETTSDLSFCPSGCNYRLTPAHNQIYRFHVWAINGRYPTITNQESTHTEYDVPSVFTRVDLIPPTTAITGPAAGSWHSAPSYTVSFSDTDNGVGVSAARWRVVSNGVPRLSASRTRNSSQTVTVGTSGYCNVQGANLCVVYAESDDYARNTSAEVSRSFSIDWTSDSISSITARTVPGGTIIGQTDWTSDRDPYFYFTANTTGQLAPISGYSWAVDADPDCDTLEVGAGNSGSVQLAANTLSEGVHTFRVRSRDAAVNCGVIRSHTVQVDYTQDTVANLRAYTHSGGGEITQGVWQKDIDPYLTWNPSSSTAPILGYAYGAGGTPNCTVRTTSTSGTVTAGNGITSLWVRAIDRANNCGPATTFNLYADNTPDAITSLSAYTQPSGDPIAPGVWQTDNSPHLVWQAAISSAPIDGYSYGTGSTQDCTIETEANSVSLTGLPDGVTTFWVKAIDEAQNCGDASTFAIHVDRTGDAISNLVARTQNGGSVIQASTWQQDRDPHLTWSAPADPMSPILGYNVRVDGTPACSVALTGTSYSFPANTLSDGVHTLNVHAVDAAGNCGPVSSFTIWVDGTGDSVDNLTVYTQPGGTEISAGTWQPDRDPYLDWDAPESPVSPIYRYTVGLDVEPLCTGNISSTDYTFPAGSLSEGDHTLYVRVKDLAGNCGPLTSFAIRVDSQGDAIPALVVWTEPDGDVIPAATWQPDNLPYLQWEAPDMPTSPIDGYSLAVDGTPACAATISNPYYAFTTALSEGTHSLNLLAKDSAGNCGAPISFEIRVDSLGDDPRNLVVLDAPGGTPIPQLAWQRDPDPHLAWDPPLSPTSPIAGYVVTADSPPPCTAAFTGESYTFATNALDDGQHTLYLRAKDEAGNCGLANAFAIWVDQTGDTVSSLVVLTEEDGEQIEPLTWQNDNTPYLQWGPPVDYLSDVMGYALEVDSVPDCTAVMTGTAYYFDEPLEDGEHTFHLRVLDQAGNCGPPSSFVLSVVTTGSGVPNLAAYTHAGGAQIPSATWQQDRDPYLAWNPPVAPISPIVHFTVSLDEDLGCVGGVTDTDYSFASDSLSNGQHTVYVRAFDEANNCGPAAMVEIWADDVADHVTALTVLTGPLGTPVPVDTWQPDVDPFIDWDEPAGIISPIAGYTVTVDTEPNCEGSIPDSHYDFAVAPLSNGEHTLYLQARDAAGNCGDWISFPIKADAQGDGVLGLEVWTEPDGEEIEASTWQQDNDPYLEWLPVTGSISPLQGYAVGVNLPPDCTGTLLFTPSYSFPEDFLDDQEHTLYVRAEDAAGNCGPAATFVIRVDTTPDPVTGLVARVAEGSAIIPEDTWQQDNDPWLQWNAPGESTSPIAGYVLTVDGTAPGEELIPVANWSFDEDALTDGVHTFAVLAKDAAGNVAEPDTYTIHVDASGDSIASLSAYTEAGGEPIADGFWQTDNSPYLTWTVVGTVSPVQYSWGLGYTDDCIAESEHNGVSLSGLPDGETRFWVRAVDAAGNCGDSRSFTLAVDRVQDQVTNLQAFTEAGGAAITPHTWQQDNDPWISWELPIGWISPVQGYAVGIDEVPSCDAVLPDLHHAVAEDALSDGQHTLYVRALDAAGHCGPAAQIEIWVWATAPTLSLSLVAPNPAKAGDTLLIQVLSNRELATLPTVLIGSGHTANHVGGSGTTFTYQYLVMGDEVDTEEPEGAPVTIQVEAEDLAGNPGETSGEVILDFIPPPLVGTLGIEPTVATTADEVTISFESGETLRTSPRPQVLVDGTIQAAFQEQIGNRYSYSHQVSGSEGEGTVDVVVTLVDLAGNPATYYQLFSLDLTPPQVTVLYPQNRLVLDLGNEIQIRWTTQDEHRDQVSIYLSSDSGTTFDQTVVEGISDTGSHLWTVTGEQTSLARFRVVATDKAGLTGYDDSDYDLRIREPVADHVVAVAEDSTALVEMSERVYLSVVDRLGDPVDGEVPITVTVTGSAVIQGTSLEDAVLTDQQAIGTTKPDGTATLDVVDLVSELVQVLPSNDTMPAIVPHIPATILFTPGNADHLVVFTTDGVAHVLGSEQLTIMAMDRNGNHAPADIRISVQTSGYSTFLNTNLRMAEGLGTALVSGDLQTDGTALITLTDAVAETVLVSASAADLPNQQPDEPAQVTFLQQSLVDSIETTIEARPGRVFADGQAFSQIEVTPRNSGGLPVGSGLTVQVTTDFGDLTGVVDQGDGHYTSQLSSTVCREEPASIGALIEDVIAQRRAWVLFTCDEVVRATMTATPQTIVADGESCAEILLRLYDEQDEPLPPGQEVAMTASYGSLGDVNETDDGGYRTDLCSTICAEQPILVSASVNGVDLAELDPPVQVEVMVECLGVDPAASRLDVDPLTLPADGVSASTITVTPIGLDSLPMGPGLEVSVEASLGSVTTTFDEGDGTYTAQVTSDEAGESVLTAEVSGVLLDDSEIVTFLATHPPTDWVLLQADLIEGTAAPEALITIQVELENRAGQEIDEVWLSLQGEEGTDLRTVLSTWSSQSIPFSADQSGGSWRIQIGRLPENPSPEPLLLLVGLRLTSQELPESHLVFRAWVGEDPISPVEELVLPLGGQPADERPGEACSCRHRADGSSGLLPCLALLGVLLYVRRRR